MSQKQFKNDVEAYLEGFSEATQAAHSHFLDLLDAMRKRTERTRPELPADYILKRFAETVQCLHVRHSDTNMMHDDAWSVSISSDNEAAAVAHLLEEYYRRKASGQ